MDDITSSVVLGLLCTFGLFMFSLVTVVGVKAIFYSVLDSIIKPKPQQEPKKAERKKRPTQKKQPSTSKPIRSIEIDPEQIDKIFVKKSS